jgi:tRNA 2-thiouridine synthesizing protein C
MNSIALVLTQSPFTSYAGQDAQDMAMVLGTFEIPTALFFMSDAVNQLRKLDPKKMAIKDFTKTFSALPFYDVEDLYVCREDLQQRQIQETSLTEDFQILDKGDLVQKLSQYQRVIRF